MAQHSYQAMDSTDGVGVDGGPMGDSQRGPDNATSLVGNVSQASRAVSMHPVNPPEGPRRILVVDDNRDAADSLATLFRMVGTDVQTAHDGMAAVSAAVAFHPHAVLLDIGLPKLDGYAVGRRIRELQGKAVILIAITGWGRDEDRCRALAAGFDEHLTKPVDFDALRRVLAQHAAPSHHRGD
jgi:CheY-like chemotaxis protein